ncbi:MAG: glutamate racemase [Hyphomicrobiales bacterium]|nr:glutamate racemase [Hyphomicrobiales bacterium]
MSPILVFDSGLGGLTVFREIEKALPGAAFVYAADDAVFPYGALAPDALVARVMSVMEALIGRWRPQAAVIACNTASTLVLPHLRARWPAIPFVGTVPAIKPCAERTKSGLISVLATPGTVARDYTRDLIASFASHCDVQLVGSKKLAGLAESFMRGGAVADADIAAEIAPCFVQRDGRRTDMIALACTHYPLLLERFRALAPWPVEWVDPAPAIARRVKQVVGAEQTGGAPPYPAIFTSGAAPDATLAKALAAFGLRADAIAAV